MAYVEAFGYDPLDRSETRKIVECITNKLVISKQAITLDLCYLRSAKGTVKKELELRGPVPLL